MAGMEEVGIWLLRIGSFIGVVAILGITISLVFIWKGNMGPARLYGGNRAYAPPPEEPDEGW